MCTLQCNVRCVHRGKQHVTASHMTLSRTRDPAALQSLNPSPSLSLSLSPSLCLHHSSFIPLYFLQLFFPQQIGFLSWTRFVLFFISLVSSIHPPTAPSPLPPRYFPLSHASLSIPCFSYFSFPLTLCALFLPAVHLTKINFSELMEKP